MILDLARTPFLPLKRNLLNNKIPRVKKAVGKKKPKFEERCDYERKVHTPVNTTSGPPPPRDSPIPLPLRPHHQLILMIYILVIPP